MVRSNLIQLIYTLMKFFQTQILITGAMLLCGGIACAEESQVEKLQREIRQLKLQNINLNQSLAETLERETAKTKSLKKMQEYLALVGKDIFDGGDAETRLLDAVTNAQIANENLVNIESSVGNLLPLIKNYLRTAITSDPEARKEVEVKMRELEVALGQRQRPKRKIEQGTAQEARIVTVDSNTGAAVMNAGSNANLSVGTRFRIERSGTHIGDAIVAITRSHVSGLLIQSLTNPEVPVRPGDLAKVITL